jgi:Xaa-Pro aminopeptidase
MVIPGFEEPRLGPDPWFPVVAWAETDDPVAALRDRIIGPVRQAAIGDRTWSAFLLRLEAAFPGAVLQSATPTLRGIRMLKDAGERSALAVAANAVDAVFLETLNWKWSGRTEQEIAEAMGAAMLKQGCEQVDFVTVGSGPNSASPHHSVSSRVVQQGDAVVLDFGGPFVDGYFADVTRTVFVGEPTSEQRTVYAAVRAAQEAGVQSVRPGVACQDVDRAARAVIDAAGLGPWFNHRVGHGIGLDVHEEPYMVEGNQLPLQEGMAFSVEPGVYLPGRFGVRIEDIVVCDTNSVDRLNAASRDLHVVN